MSHDPLSSVTACKKILIVDNEAIIALAESEVVRAHGYETVTSSSGEKAIDMVEADSSIDLVLMDIDLGAGIDGTEAARQILAIRNIPIVFLTSHSERAMVEKVRGITRYGYVLKDSGDFVLTSSIEMAFELFEAHMKTAHSEERYRLLLQNANDAVYVHEISPSAPGRFLEVNDQACRMLGYTREEFLQMNVPDIDVPEQSERLPGIQRQLFESGHTIFCTRHLAKDGRCVPVEISARLFDIHGKPTILSVVRDITERTQVQALLQARADLLQFSASHSLEEVNQAAIDRVGELTGSPIGFYHFYEGDQTTIFLGGWSTRTRRDFCKAAGEGTHYPLSQAGVWADCIRERRPVIHNDYASLPHRKGLPPGHAPVDRELVVPVFIGERIVAVMGVGNKPQDYTENDVHVVSYLAEVAWHITERKRAEEALLWSEERYRAIFEGSVQGILAADVETKGFLYANPSICRMLGYSKSELLNLSVTDIHPEEAMNLAMSEFDSQVRGEKPTASSLPCLRKDGTVFYADIVTNATVFKGRKIALGFFIDVTERMRAEESLNEAKKLLLDIIDSIPSYVYAFDTGGRCLLINRELEALFGCTSGEFVGRTRESVLPAHIAAQHRNNDLAVLKSMKPLTIEETNLAPDGVHTYLTVKFPLYDKSGNVYAIGGVSTDITERRKSREALQRSEELFRSLFESIPVGYQSLDAEGRLIEVNLRWCELMGYPREEVIGRWFGDFLAPAMVDAFRERFPRFKDTGSIEVEFEMIRRDGSPVTIAFVGRIGHTPGGDFKQAHCILLDITGRRER